MQRTLLKSKIHRARVTGADLHYEGSITLDVQLMQAANLLPNEQVDIYNVDNGQRFHTYVIPGEAGSGDVVLNGAAARLVQPGDRVIIASYAAYEDAEAREHNPVVILVDANNVIREGVPST